MEVRQKEILKRLLRAEGKRHSLSYGLAFLMMSCVAACTALAAYLMKDIVNEIFINKDMTALKWVSLSIVGIYLVKGFATFGQNITLSRIGNSIIAHYQGLLYNHLLKQDMSFFATRTSTDLLTRLTYASANAKDILQIIVVSAGRDVLTLVGLSSVMIIQDPKLGLMAMIALPIGALGLGKLLRRMRKFAKRSFDGNATILGIMQETVQGLKVVKAFTLEDIMRERMSKAIETVRISLNKMMATSALASPVAETLGGLVIATVVMVGGQRVILGGESPGTFFSFITALLLAYEPAKRLGRMNLEIQNAMVGVSLLFEVLDTPATEDVDSNPAIKVKMGEIKFEDVTFTYPDRESSIRNLNLKINAGETLALVGSSGSGKSTTLALLMRLYNPQSGSIYIDGQNIQKVSRSSIRNCISIVSQDVFLFKGTVLENIRHGAPMASNEQIYDAAKSANAHEFIMEMPNGYETDIGELGGQLSGGQRQRIAIARAIIKNAPIILLDEATAALDNLSEKAVQNALAKLTSGRTTIIVAHRLESITHADRIMVMKDGTIIETGTREELLSSKGAYHALAMGKTL